MNPIYAIDFYKVGHQAQYQNGITRIWTNWTPRSSRRPERQGAIHFGLQPFMKEFLIKQFANEFFGRPERTVLDDYHEVIEATLGVVPKSDHIRELHRMKYLPIEIYSVPEGTFVPCGVPAMVVVNTDPRFFWLPNYLETVLSNSLWQPSTTATTASIYRQIFESAAREFGETDLSFVDYQGHDFSYRGLSGLEAAELSGMGHLLFFSGTDTLPAILAARKHYSAELSCGGSVPATEHSVMSAGGATSELATFRRLLTEVYPKGVLSIVSDTWDLWKVLTEILPALKDEILARDGKLVIRPDSGDPVKILTGDPDSTYGPERAGVLRLLADLFGTDGHGHINKAGAIYGDSITPERAWAIVNITVRELNLSPYNVVLGIGSFTYQYVTRDTYGFAMKATAVEQGGKVIPIFKDPVTDDGGKKSHFGIPVAVKSPDGPLFCKDNMPHEALTWGPSAFHKVFEDGRLLRVSNFAEIRARARAQKFTKEATA